MTTPNEIIRAMFDHHLWATEALIDHLESLPADRLDASVPGTSPATPVSSQGLAVSRWRDSHQAMITPTTPR